MCGYTLVRCRSLALQLVLVGCATAGSSGSSTSAARSTSRQVVDVRVVSDEAEAALAILEKQRRGTPPEESDWNRLFATEGYRRLRQREAAMSRPFTDSSFRAFLLSDSLARRAADLAAAVSRYASLDIHRAATQALAYLPAGATIRARLYPLIKPVPNTFVFTADSVAGIFLYVDPARSADVESNTLTHELHHIGYGTICDAQADSTEPEAVRVLRQRLYGFGEGLAMLAAAGGPDIHPHQLSDTADRHRWDRDVAHLPADMRTLERFFLDVLDRRITSPDSVVRVAITFYGVQGPWYTVGWQMASTIEKAYGRERLREVMCDPLLLMRTYNAAAAAPAARGAAKLPLWSDELLRKLSGGAQGAR